MISVEIHCVAAVMVLVSGICEVEIGKNHVYFRRMLCRFPVFWFTMWRIGSAISANALCSAAISIGDFD